MSDYTDIHGVKRVLANLMEFAIDEIDGTYSIGHNVINMHECVIFCDFMNLLLINFNASLIRELIIKPASRFEGDPNLILNKIENFIEELRYALYCEHRIANSAFSQLIHH